MDKASIVKDAIDYIQELRDQEGKIRAEIAELESVILKKNPGFKIEQERSPVHPKSKRKRTKLRHDSSKSPDITPIEVLEVTCSLSFSVSINYHVYTDPKNYSKAPY